MPYNFVANSLRTKKRCSRLSSALIDGKRPFGVFAPLFGGLEATYAVYLRLIGKRV